ncbi:MAG: DUF551 domain-containing protein [Anaerovoracaceae bacterium]|jgi:hypothetical protein
MKFKALDTENKTVEWFEVEPCPSCGRYNTKNPQYKFCPYCGAGWISPKNKLPGKFETVLLTVIDEETGNKIVETGSYDRIKKEWQIDAQMPDHRLCDREAVTAWQPLPTEYRRMDK